MPDQQSKSCFFIAPIGAEGTEARRRSDQVLRHIITPAAKECGYTPVRADQIPQPGIITTQVIGHLLNDDLVVADLTGGNPNVYYELAVRHAVKKPVVQIIDDFKNLPFDVALTRTIELHFPDPDSIEACKRQLVEQIRAAEKDPGNADSPISTAVNVLALNRSDDPVAKSIAEMMTSLQELRAMIGNLYVPSQRSVLPQAPVIAISPASGATGTVVTVAGSGFGANETGITVAYDGTAVVTSIAADAHGAWVATFAIPPSAPGAHKISAYVPTTFFFGKGSAAAVGFNVVGVGFWNIKPPPTQ